MTMSHLEALFEHNRWANLRLLAFCRDQPDVVLDAPGLAGTFGAIRDTWIHLLGNEEDYLSHDAWKAHAPWLTIETTIFKDRRWQGFDQLETVIREVGDAYLRLARELPAGVVLEGDVDGAPVRTLASVILVQVIDHSTEHRTHIRACLTAQGVEPPDVHGWAWDDATEPGR
jgi:uncharacterized damage-inducible protein DinB